jgi:3-hydroxyisobutyrate dehydrogenase
MKVALVGVGFMGKGIVQNLAKKLPRGSQLSVYDVKFQDSMLAKEFVEDCRRLDTDPSSQRVKVAGSPKEAANSANMIALSLPSDKITEDVLFGEQGVTRANNLSDNKPKLIIEHGTFSRDFILNCHSRCQQAGFDYMDAPVSGGPGGAALGSLTIMAGGDTASIIRARPLLELYSSNIFHFGGVGRGMAAKLVNQALVVMHAAAAADALHLASQFELDDLGSLKALLASSWGQSKILDLALDDLIACKGDREGLKNSRAPLRNLLKDVDCIAKDIQASSGQGDYKSMQLKTLANAQSAIEDACANGFQDAAFISLMERIGVRK